MITHVSPVGIISIFKPPEQGVNPK